MPTGTDKPFVSISLPTPEGMVHARHYVVVGSSHAVVLVGTVSQRFDGPEGNVYPRLATDLKQKGVTSLHVSLCNADDLELSVHDVRRAIHYLCELGSKTVILVGYQRGATAMLRSADHESCVKGIALLSPTEAPQRDQAAGISVLLLGPKTGPDELYRRLDDWIRTLRSDGTVTAA